MSSTCQEKDAKKISLLLCGSPSMILFFDGENFVHIDNGLIMDHWSSLIILT
jgi:hypothetical protein